MPEHDVLIGGFPCQPFSTLGKLKGFEDEERGTLFFVIKEIIKKHRTKVVVLENVKNIMNHDNGKTFKRILSELEELGYTCYSEVLNSADYGIPQRRNRCYIVAFLKDYFRDSIFTFPEKKKLTLTTQDLLDEIVEEKYFLTKKIYPTIMGRGTKNYVANLKNNRKLYFHNKHRLVNQNLAIGGKTGYTKKAGRTLITVFNQNGRELVVVTMDAYNDWNLHRSLVNAYDE
jgi:DNA (cytosine-5)-methyltransferase 1